MPLLLEFIRELAEYERLAHRVEATEGRLRDSLFGPNPHAEATIAWAGGEAVGFALFFPSYSTFLARPGMYLEDLYVRPAWRGKGVGRRLLEHLAALCAARGYPRMEWSVLDWNEPARGFYRRLSAAPLEDWTTFRLSGEALERLAGLTGRADPGNDEPSGVKPSPR